MHLIRKLADLQHHYLISPEVKRELSQGRSRGEKDPDAEMKASAAAAASRSAGSPRVSAPRR